MGLMEELDTYREERMRQFDDAFEQLRQELVDDLAKKYREAGVPAVFKYEAGRQTLTMKIPGGDEFTEALVSGDEKQIGSALSVLLAMFVAMRDRNETGKEGETP